MGAFWDKRSELPRLAFVRLEVKLWNCGISCTDSVCRLAELQVINDLMHSIGSHRWIRPNFKQANKIIVSFWKLVKSSQIWIEISLMTCFYAQQLESVCWHRKGDQFISSHNDGSYIKWDASDPLKSSTPVSQYGPFPCKGISKILWRSAKGYESLNMTSNFL